MHGIGSVTTESTIYLPLKALPVLMCMKNTALGDVSQVKYSTRLHLMLYLSLDTLLVLYFPYTFVAVL